MVAHTNIECRIVLAAGLPDLFHASYHQYKALHEQKVRISVALNATSFMAILKWEHSTQIGQYLKIPLLL